MTRQEQFEANQREWLALQFDGLTDEIPVISPSKWAEERRYLPPQVTPLPGYYNFEVTPYIREILDCMSMDSPIREVSVMKGAQIAATTGLLENTIGYFIDHVKTAPIMMVTADADMALLRLESYITPMLQYSDLMHLMRSADESNKRKTGRTNKKLEWIGGGSLVPFGAQNANKFRMITAQVLLNDEVDGWPDTVGKDGDPVELIRKRAASYEANRKVLDLSTPLIQGQSKIETLYKRGDQRKYHVRCLRCEFQQVLRWSHTDNETGVTTGMAWETEGGRLVPDSVRYLCRHCSHEHTNSDKTKLFAESSGAEWLPTTESVSPFVRSYHLSALYSPVGMQSWGMQAQMWLEAWDVEKSRARDGRKLQVFYNTVLGETYELRGDFVRFESVSAHRRSEYRFGEIPNNAFALRYCGSCVLLLTCTVDVHDESINVAVFGWCVERRAMLVEYKVFEGDCKHLDDAATWGELRKLFNEKEYTADDDKRYRVNVMLIDSGHLTDVVYSFCQEFETGVYPIKGTAVSPKSARVPEFAEFKSPGGMLIYGITVDLYKDRWSVSLRRGWDGMGLQPQGHFNAPADITDKQLKELAAEVKMKKLNKQTGDQIGFEWKRKGANELWDLLVYANAALDLMAWHVGKSLEWETTNWTAFWDLCQDPQTSFYEEG